MLYEYSIDIKNRDDMDEKTAKKIGKRILYEAIQKHHPEVDMKWVKKSKLQVIKPEDRNDKWQVILQFFYGHRAMKNRRI